MQIKEWRCKGFEDSKLFILFHFHGFQSSYLIHHFRSNITIFFHHPSPKKLSLNIILELSQSLFFIQQVYSWINQWLDSSINSISIMVEADMTRSSCTCLNRDYEPYLSSLFIYTVPIFEGLQNSLTKIQDDGDANTRMKIQRVWRLWTLHIFSLWWVLIFFSYLPFQLQYYHFFPLPITRRA